MAATRRSQGRRRPGAERLALVAYAWLAVFFMAPLALTVRLSLSDTALSIPPYAPQFDPATGAAGLLSLVRSLDLEAYARFFHDRLYIDAYASSLAYAAAATAILVLISYPMALAMARAPLRWRPVLVAVATLPFWTSFLVRITAWIGVLSRVGLMNTPAGVLIGLVYGYLPCMLLPLYATLEREDGALLEAAADLGAGPWTRFWTITLPTSLPGLFAGALISFIPMVGEFVIPDLLGGSDTLMAGKLIWTAFFADRDWPAAAAAGVLLIATLAAPIALAQRLRERIT